MRRIALAALLLATACGPAHPASAPAPAPPAASGNPLTTPGFEQALGALSAAMNDSSRRAYADARLTGYVREVGRRLMAATGRTDLPLDLIVTDQDDPEAISTPGGHVRISRGLLAVLGNEAELAAVLAHEIAHSELGHGLQSFWSRALDLEPDDEVKQDQQLQADRRGVELLRATGYAPRAMPRMLRMIQKAMQARGARTDPRHTLARVGRLMRLIGHDLAGNVSRDDYLAHLDGLVFGADLRLGALAGRTFTCERDGFALDLPAGWTGSWDSDTLTATAPDGSSLRMTGHNAPASTTAPGDAPALPSLGRFMVEGVEARTHRATSVGGLRLLIPAEAPASRERQALLAAPAHVWKLHATSDAATWASLLSGLRPARPDPSREPRRLRVRRAERTASMSTALTATCRSPQGGEALLVNDADPDDEVSAGDLLRCIEP